MHLFILPLGYAQYHSSTLSANLSVLVRPSLAAPVLERRNLNYR
jgi:hypothetical protein